MCNRRSAWRKPICLRIDLLPIWNEEADLWPGRLRRGLSVNLSEGGIMAFRAGFLPIGSLVRVIIRLPDQPQCPVAANARVVRCDVADRPRYGLKFVGLGLTEARRTQRFIG